MQRGFSLPPAEKNASALISICAPQSPGQRLSALWAAAHNRINWLFAGSLRAGQRAAAVMSLIQSAKLNGHDPYVYLKDVLARLPTQNNSHIGEFVAAPLAAHHALITL